MTLAFGCVQLDTGLEIFQLISGQKVCHYLGGDKGGGGVKNWDFYGDILFEWPLNQNCVRDVIYKQWIHSILHTGE